MAGIAFYALREDVRSLIHEILEETDLRIFESYSRYDSDLREFRSFSDLSDAFPLGTDVNGHGSAVLLQLWSPSVTPTVQFERIPLKLHGHSYRYRIDGVGLIQLYFGGQHDQTITASHYGHWTEAGARQRAVGDVGAVNWSALALLSGRIQRRIRNKLAVAKVHGCPILPTAFGAIQEGLTLSYSTLKFHADPPEIQQIKRRS